VVVSHVDVTRDGLYVIAVHSRVMVSAASDHVVVYDVNTEQVLCDECTQSNVLQIITTDDTDKVSRPTLENWSIYMYSTYVFVASHLFYSLFVWRICVSA